MKVRSYIFKRQFLSSKNHFAFQVCHVGDLEVKLYVLFGFVSFAINPIIPLDDGKGIRKCMATVPPNTNKERTREISPLFAAEVVLF